jgi:hypothetical protein
MPLQELARPPLLDTAVLTQYMTPTTDADANRAALQQVIDRIAPSGLGKGAKLFIPPRWDGSGNPDPITVSRNGSNAWALDVPSNTVIDGAGQGSALKLAAGQANFTRLLRIQDKHDVVIRNLRIDGNRDNNDLAFEHNHCIFVYDSSDVVIEDVETVNATGDGVSISGTVAKSRDIHVNRLRSTGHKRNPVTVEQADDVWITNSYLIAAADSGGQAIDSEPFSDVATGRLYIVGNIIGHLNPAAAYSLTFSGKSQTYPRSGIQIIGNEFRGGGLNGNNVEDVVIAGNTGDIINLYSLGYSNRVLVANNAWNCTSAVYAIEAQFTSTFIPAGWTIADNALTTPNGGGMNFQGVDNLTIRGGSLIGGGTGNGIRTQATRSTKNHQITGLLITGYTKGLYATRSSTNTHDGLLIGGNTFDTIGTALDLESTVAFLSNVVVQPNVMRSVTTPISINTSTPYVTSGTPGRAAAWNCNGTPEGAITERIGATAIRRDGGASTTFYVKESGTGNTGWVAK